LSRTQPSTQNIVASITFELFYDINRPRKQYIYLWLLCHAEDKKKEMENIQVSKSFIK
jgi:hypothetical protein